MKRRDLIKKIESQGAVLIRHGGNRIGIRTRQRKFASPCLGTTRSTNISPAASCENSSLLDKLAKLQGVKAAAVVAAPLCRGEPGNDKDSARRRSAVATTKRDSSKIGFSVAAPLCRGESRNETHGD